MQTSTRNCQSQENLSHTLTHRSPPGQISHAIFVQFHNKSGICRVIRLELQLSLIHAAVYLPSSLQQNVVGKKKKAAISARIGPKRHTTCFHKDKEANKTLRKTKLQTSVTLTIRIPPRYFHFFRSDKTKEKAREKQRTSCRNLAPGMQNRGKMKMKTVKWKRTNTQTRRRTKGGNG